MLLVGLTGGIASGKSAVASRLIDLGAVVLDADRIARDIVEPGEDAYTKIVEHFGSEILQPDRRIDREKLGKIIFADPAKRTLLNEITHPRVMGVIADRLEELRPTDSIVVCDIPLLAEAGVGREMFDLIVVVSASPATQAKRLSAERGMSRDDAAARLEAQASDAERRVLADVVIDNDGTLDALRARVDELWSDLSRRLAASASS